MTSTTGLYGRTEHWVTDTGTPVQVLFWYGDISADQVAALTAPSLPEGSLPATTAELRARGWRKVDEP